jgi:hypothetical protein
LDGEVTHGSKEDLNAAEAKDSEGESEIIAVMDLNSDLTIVLPDDDPIYWDMLLYWVYHDTIPILKRAYSSEVGWNWDPCTFYVLADKLDIPLLKDKIISALQEGQAKSKLWQYIERLDWTWERTRPGCGMRRYLVLALVRNIVVYKDPKEPNLDGRFTVPTKEIVAVLRKHSDLLEAVVEILRGQDGIQAKDPRMAHPCAFHEHWPSRSCTYSEDIDEVQVKDEGKKEEESKDEVDLDKKQGENARKKVVRFKDVPDSISVECS